MAPKSVLEKFKFWILLVQNLYQDLLFLDGEYKGRNIYVFATFWFAPYI
jgi:hypothetical protein